MFPEENRTRICRDGSAILLMPHCWKAAQSSHAQLRLAALRVAMLMPKSALAKRVRRPGPGNLKVVGSPKWRFNMAKPSKHIGLAILKS